MVTDCLREASQQRRLVRVRCSQRGNALCEHHLTSLPPSHVAQVREDRTAASQSRGRFVSTSASTRRTPDVHASPGSQVSLTGRPLFAFTFRA